MRALVSELGAQLAAIYGPRLHTLILYGSYARGQARSGSDVDVAAVLEGFERTWPEIDRTGSLVSRLSLKYGTTVSLVPIRRRDWELKRTRLARSLDREGLPVG